jgi:hypothetical protein
MGKQQRQGHYCKVCQRYRANEKFGGKGRREHICKSCNQDLQRHKREQKRATQKATEVGLRPVKKPYPKTARQAASYLQIELETFETYRQQLVIEPCETLVEWGEEVPLYDIDAMIAVYQAIENANIGSNTCSDNATS